MLRIPLSYQTSIIQLKTIVKLTFKILLEKVYEKDYNRSTFSVPHHQDEVYTPGSSSTSTPVHRCKYYCFMYTKFTLHIGIYIYPVGSIHLSPTYFLFGLRGLTGNSVNGSSKRSLLRKLANRSRKSFLKNSHCHSNSISKPERPKKVVVVTVNSAKF